MKTPSTRLAHCLLVLFLASFSVVSAHNFNVLVFTKEAGATHSSTAAGVTALNELGISHDFTVTDTSDAATFISALPTTNVVVFLNTTGDVLNASQQTSFQSWYQAGGGFVGIHAATDTEHDWPWYLEMVGAEFDSHGSVQIGTVEFLDQVHPITNVIDSATSERVVSWSVNEEWYNFVSSPRGTVHVLAQVDELVTTANPDEPADTGISGGTHGNDHPIMWCHSFDGGRSAYLGPGHEAATFSDDIFRGLMTNAVEWAAGELGGDSGATINANFEKIELETNLSNPMSLDVAPNGTIYLVERKGAVKAHNQSTGVTTTIGTLNEYNGGEFGVMGIALDPNFTTNDHLYILWSPSSGTDTRLSRFTLNGSGNLDLGSEVVMMDYLANRPSSTGAQGSHQSGCLRFDPQGNLIISTGDNTSPSPYSPRSNNIGSDARKSSPNTNDLRGKILRITPNVGGGPAGHPNYTIPAGNLFSPGQSNTREEIYVMGARNCFRICVDPVTGWIYYGDVGPDANDNGSGGYQGPKGHDEFNQVKSAGWFGWPFYVGDNKPYRDGSGIPWTPSTIDTDLTSYFSSSSFTSSGASAGDTSLLTNPQPAWIWYPYSASPPAFSELGSGARCAMAGAVYQYAPGQNFPDYYDRSVFIMEWSRNTIFDVRTRPDGSILEITRFAPHITFQRPMDMVFGEDGTMYMIEWGPQFGLENSSGSKLVKVQYTAGVSTPVAIASADVTSGPLDLTVNFSSAGTFDPDAGVITYAWDFDGDQVTDSTDPNPSHTYTVAGDYAVQLTVTDDGGLFSRANINIFAGNSEPALTFLTPANFSFFDWGDIVAYEFTVTDPEDGSSAGGQITDSDVLLEASLGHDDHQHNELQYPALMGQVTTPRDIGHPFDLDIGYVFDAFYTDAGAPGVSPIQGSAKTVLQPKLTMAQTFDGQSGLVTLGTQDAVGGGLDVVSIDHDDHLYFTNLNLDGITSIRLRAAAAGSGGNVKIRQDSPTGNLIATIPVTTTGGWANYGDYTSALSGVLPGSHDLYFVFENSSSPTDILRLNWINFRGNGATLVPNRPVVEDFRIAAVNTLEIDFDQEMDKATLSSLGNYSLDGGATVVTATPYNDQTGVTLVISGATQGNYYSLTLSGLEDLAGDSMAAGEAITVYYQPIIAPTFITGLNAGGSDFTDSDGNLYIDDTTNVPGTGNNVTLLVDFHGSGGGTPVTSTATHFAAADAAIDTSATVNVITSSGFTNTPVSGSGISGATLSNAGSSGSWNTSKGFYNGDPILDGYIYEGDNFGTGSDSLMSLSGLGDIDSGSTMTLTLWGVGDTAGADNTFRVNYNGSIAGTQTTDYDDNNQATSRKQFTITKVAGVDTITIDWGVGGFSTTGFCGLSLTVAGVPPESYIATASTLTSTTGDGISNTLDDTLYQSERYKTGGFDYSIPVPNGSYDVTLRLAEIYHTTNGSRTFNVRAESSANLFSPDIDIHNAVGHDAALDYSLENITVSDGKLDLMFIDNGPDNPKISAIGIFDHVPGGSTIPDPSFATYLSTNPESRYSATSDIDNDGIATLLEYAFGGNDQAADLEILPDMLSDGAGDLDFEFTRPAGLPDVIYSAEASETLDNWVAISPTVVVTPLVGGTEKVRFEGLEAAAINAGLTEAAHCFFRVKVELTSPAP